MTEKEKQLLLIDLSARLPYGVIVKYKDQEGNEENVKLGYGNIYYVATLNITCWKDCKPYLRPMSNMTEEEAIKYITLTHYNTDNNGIPYRESTVESLDWLLEHHFDYRGLIENGLALKAPKGMYV